MLCYVMLCFVCMYVCMHVMYVCMFVNVCMLMYVC